MIDPPLSEGPGQDGSGPSPQPPSEPAAPASPPPRADVEPRHGALISRVRARQRSELWLQGAFWGLGAGLVPLLAAGFAAQLSVGLGRVLLVLAPLTALGVAAGFGFWLAARRVGDDRRTARLIGERIPGVSLELLSAVELRQALERERGFSADLARAFLDAADQRAAAIDAVDVVDRLPTKRAMQALGALCLIGAALLWTGGPRWRKGLATLTARAPQAAAAAPREPITGDIELTYKYPAYTGLAQKTVAGTNGEISAPAGTEVLIKTRADRDVTRADLVVNGKRLPMGVNGTRDLSGAFVLDQSGQYAFTFLRGERELARGPDTAIKVVPDAPPQVVIQTPAEELEVDPAQQVVIRFEATDDYGLTALELVYHPPGKAKEVRVPLRHDEGRHTRGQYAWELKALALGAGDRVSYFIEAQDNDAVAGKKKGASRTHVLKLYSAVEHRREALKKAELLWDKLVTHLADRLEGPDRGPAWEPSLILGAQSIDRSGLTLTSELLELARELSGQRDAPEEVIGALTNISQGLRPKVLATVDGRRNYLRLQRAQSDGIHARRLTAAVNAEIAELEKDILYLEALIDREKIHSLQELARDLAAAKRELVSQVEEYKQTQDPQLQADILRQIEQLKARINDLMAQMSELAKGIRDEHFNKEAMQELMEQKDLQSQLDEVEKLMREGKADEALKKLQELSTQMEEMMKNLQDEDENGGAEDYPELAEKFQKFTDELHQVTNEQQRAADQTKALRDRYRQQMKERLQQKAQAIKDQLLKSAEQVSKDYQQIDPNEMTPHSELPLERAQAELENLKNALKVDDFDLAAEAAQRAEQSANELADNARQQQMVDERFERAPDERGQSRRHAERMDQDRQQVEDINKKLQQLFPPPGSTMSDEDKQKLKQLSGEQRQLEKRAQGLRKQMEEIQQMAPLFGEEAQQQMDQVGERMDQAAEKMEGKDPGRGYGEQKGALEGLSQFEQQMKQQQQRKGGKGGGMPIPFGSGGQREGWGQRPNKKVEIPDADQFQAPKEFRKDLLDAMKQGAPDKYRDQVKRYYEELVK